MNRQPNHHAHFAAACRQAAYRRVRCLLAVCALLIAPANARAQDGPPPLPVDPTPLGELLAGRERLSFDEARNPKKLIETCLDISEAHLGAALAAIKARDIQAAERELDIYRKAAAHAVKVTGEQQDGRRSLSKKIEQRLYKQIKTLESIEELFPAERIAFAEAALKHAKALRVQALNEAFAGGEILQDPEKAKPKTNPPAKEPPVKNGAADKTGSLKPDGPAESFHTPLIHRLAQQQPGERTSTQIPGDYLTEEEDQHVREAQQADERIKVFMKIADRRLEAITGTAVAATDKKAQKKADEEDREWGVLLNVNRADLLRHYARAVDECMAKLEDAYERNPKSGSIKKALAILRDSTDRHLQTLRSLSAQMKTGREADAMKDAIEKAELANKGARDSLSK